MEEEEVAVAGVKERSTNIQDIEEEKEWLEAEKEQTRKKLSL